VQEKESVGRAVCFTPTKHAELHTLQQTKSGSVSNFVKASQGDDVIFNHYTKITPLDSTKVDFVYSDKLSTTEMVKSISACNDLANEQLISLKAQVVQITSVKKIHIQLTSRYVKEARSHPDRYNQLYKSSTLGLLCGYFERKYHLCFKKL
jgi:hypothetical protein